MVLSLHSHRSHNASTLTFTTLDAPLSVSESISGLSLEPSHGSNERIDIEESYQQLELNIVEYDAQIPTFGIQFCNASACTETAFQSPTSHGMLTSPDGSGDNEEVAITVETISCTSGQLPQTFLALSVPAVQLERAHDYVIVIQAATATETDVRECVTVLDTRSLSATSAEIVVYRHEHKQCCFVQLPHTALGSSLAAHSAYHAFHIRLPKAAVVDICWDPQLSLKMPDEYTTATLCLTWKPVRQQSVHIHSDFELARKDLAAAWHVTSLIRKVAVGQYAHVHVDQMSTTYVGKFIEIRAVEQGWAEFNVQLWPVNTLEASRGAESFIFLRVPLSEVILPLRFVWWYAFNSSRLTNTLSLSHLSRPFTSVNRNPFMRRLLK